MIRSRLSPLALVFALILGNCGYANAEIVEWSSNGHLYEVISVPGGITWNEANAAATTAGRYLATITSSEESDFVFTLANDPKYWITPGAKWGPWLGGFQSPDTGGPADDWQWVTGETWDFTNWAYPEPNDYNGLKEDTLCYITPGSISGRTPTWNDVSSFNGSPIAYVTEWSPVPEPSTLLLLAMGTVGLLVCRRRWG